MASKPGATLEMKEHKWFTSIHRDSYASHIGHKDMLSFFSIANNQHAERVRLTMVERMLQPCGSLKKAEDWSFWSIRKLALSK